MLHVITDKGKDQSVSDDQTYLPPSHHPATEQNASTSTHVSLSMINRGCSCGQVNRQHHKKAQMQRKPRTPPMTPTMRAPVAAGPIMMFSDVLNA
jgi:hypothetical protein